MPELAEVGDFCPNGTRPDGGKTDEANIVKYGTTAKGLQRYRCRTCGKTFLENIGTIFYGAAPPAEEIVETLALVVEGSRVASLAERSVWLEEVFRKKPPPWGRE